MTADGSEGVALALRSLLFVPGDRPERMVKALTRGADALILDLEDAVALAAKPGARQEVAAFLCGHSAGRPCQLFVRINPLDGPEAARDLAALAGTAPDGIVLPKAEGAAAIRQLVAMMAQHGLALPILALAGETPRGVFEMGSYGEVADRLVGLTWGAEDLPAAVGAVSRDAAGGYTPPFEMVRSLTMFAAHAAGVQAIDTVFPAFRDLDGLAACVARARRDGFTGMMAIHPDQVPVINAGFTPGADEVAEARRVVEAFAANPEAGVLQLDGKMIDLPHLKAARGVLARARS